MPLIPTAAAVILFLYAQGMKSVYLALGVNLEGHKELLGLWLAENEGYRFWLGVLTELQNRGVKDILIACVDGLKGFPDAIATAFPQTQIQLCIVHMVRNSLKFVPWKDYKSVTTDLKQIYQSTTEEEALGALEQFADRWGEKYPQISKSWRSNWENLNTLFEYPPEIRKAIYTTNAIESLNSVISKATKRRKVFPTDDSAKKVIYLAIREASKKWTMPIRNWKSVLLDNGYLTDLRTAAAGAVAARWLAREDAASAAILGAGMQARLQLEALTLVRGISSARVWARDADKARDFAAARSTELGIEVVASASPREAVAGADIVVTTTPSSEPLLRLEDLGAGQHVTAMGSDAEHKNELDPRIVVDAGRYFCDRTSQVAVLGELHHAIESGLCGEDVVSAELGEVIAGSKPGRRSETEITVCDLTGTGAQDTAIATLARQRAEAAGRGTRFAN